ncbi:MAG TPA: MarR family transcriptional regulator [Mycobacteriales bacterium]|nr:MarR family transcriptional regulator [Mycobacteriales bacterium]
MPDAAEEAFAHIASVSRSLKTLVERRLIEHGVYAGQHLILGCLWEQDGLTPGQLARRIGLETPTVTRAVQRMESHELVLRSNDDTDRRLVRVWLTPRGSALRRVVPRVLAQVRKEVFADLTVREQTVLAQLLDRVRVPHPSPD